MRDERFLLFLEVILLKEMLNQIAGLDFNTLLKGLKSEKGYKPPSTGC